MSHTTSAPTTFGQLSVLRSLAGLGATGQHHANLTHVCRVPAGLSATAVEAAWHRVVQHNDSLRTTFDLTAGRPAQVIHRDRAQQLEHRELGVGGFDAALATARDLAATPFNISGELPWRAFIGSGSDREPVFLGIAVHHAAADHAGCLSIDRQFMSALNGEELSPPGQPSELAQEQQADLKRHDQAIDFWTERWSTFHPKDRTGTDTSPRSRAHLYSKAGMEAVSQLSSELRVSLQSVVLAVTSLVISRLAGRRELTLGLMAANRLDPRWAETVTSMNQLAPVQVSADPALAPLAFLRQTYLSSLQAYMNGQYDVDRLRTRLEESGVPQPDPITFDSYFNYLGDAGDDADDDDLVSQSVELRTLPRRVGPRLNLTIATGAGMHIVLRASSDYLPPEKVSLAAASIEAGLVSLARHQPSTVDQISIEPIREVSRT